MLKVGTKLGYQVFKPVVLPGSSQNIPLFWNRAACSPVGWIAVIFYNMVWSSKENGGKVSGEGH